MNIQERVVRTRRNGIKDAMAAPRTQLLRLSRVAFQPTPASTSSYNALSKSLPRLFARCMTTKTVSTPDASADLPPPQPAATATATEAAESVPIPAKPEIQEAQPKKKRRGEQLQLTTATNVKITRKFGRVISAGRMDKTVRVEYRHTVYDKHIRRPFPAKSRLLVADPRNSCREGDVIQFGNGWRASKNVHHVVERIVAPFGTAIRDRPSVTWRATLEQRKADKLKGGEEQEVRVGKTKAKVLRRLEAEKVRLAQEDEIKRAEFEAIETRRKMQADEAEKMRKSIASEKWKEEEMAIIERALRGAK